MAYWKRSHIGVELNRRRSQRIFCTLIWLSRKSMSFNAIGGAEVERIPPFSAQHLQAACKVLGDTDRGLTGSEIGYLLADVRVTDVDPEMTKWKRLFNALA